MPATYHIHPAIGVARLGNSPDEFYIGPEAPAALPIACDEQGNPLRTPDGTAEETVKRFKDAKGRVKRQAARFWIWVKDDDHPEGRPLKIGDRISGGGNQGTLVDVQWRVWLANKKAAWYSFEQLQGEHGYGKGHPRRNADVTDSGARQQLIIDPGPRAVNCTTQRTARFDRHGGDYAATFPPPLKPHSIDTLGELKTDDTGRLLVLGGHGRSGSWKAGDFGQPRIDHYANNDGWFDDTSDGPVMARLVMFSEEVQRTRYVDVEYPAWVIVGYPRYVPEVLDMITMDEVLEDVSIRQLATRPDLYGIAGTFDDPRPVDRSDPAALALWRASALRWNPDHRPWFFRDIWPILFRPDEFSYLSNVLGQSNFPHNQSTRGTFDPEKLGTPPIVNARRARDCERQVIARHERGELFIETLQPALDVLEKQAQAELHGVLARSDDEEVPGADDLLRQIDGVLTTDAAGALRQSVETYVAAVRAVMGEGEADEDIGAYLRRWRGTGPAPEVVEAKNTLEGRVDAIVDALPWHGGSREDRGRVAYEGPPTEGGPEGVRQVFEHLGAQLRIALQEHLRKLHTGRLLEEGRRRCVEAHTYDPYRAYRQFLFELLREPGEENRFFAGGSPDGRTHNLPLMPLLAGDNPISNVVPSKFLRLTDYQYYLLRQWAAGLFINEKQMGWGDPDPWWPYGDWKTRTAHDLDRAVLSNVLGGAFCPGGEAGWVMRNSSIYHEPYRIKADPAFYAFQLTAAQSNARSVPEGFYTSYIGDALSQDNDFSTGLQPGDVTKYMALPWQSDFNECSTQDIDVTYLDWNVIDPESDGDAQTAAAERVWETLWWPAHRPMQVNAVTAWKDGQPSSFRWQAWALGVPQTNAGDLKMVTEWWRLGFVIRNRWAKMDASDNINPPLNPPPYISVESSQGRDDDDDDSDG